MGKTKRPTCKKLRGLRITFLMSRDGESCALCGSPLDRHIKDPRHPEYITFDHKIPVSKGGLDEMSNVQLAHYKCNNMRGNEDLEDVCVIRFLEEGCTLK